LNPAQKAGFFYAFSLISWVRL